MKKLSILILVSIIAFSAQAKVLRVSNVVGSTAQYSSFDEAYAVAEANDVIIFDGSPTSYGSITIDDIPVTIMGHGYNLINNISKNNSGDVKFENIDIYSPGTKICSLTFNYIIVHTSDVIITRCSGSRIGYGLLKGAGYMDDTKHSNIVIHQNMIGRIAGAGGQSTQCFSNIQITNNIFYGSNTYDDVIISNVLNSLIENNTAWGRRTAHNFMNKVENSSVRNNVYNGKLYNYTNVTNAEVNNMSFDIEGLGKWEMDYQVEEATKNFTEQGVGAFAGEDPYVISGVPSGPVIEDVEMPVSVDVTEKLEIKVKVKIQK